jgi:proline dehydrogenase
MRPKYRRRKKTIIKVAEVPKKRKFNNIPTLYNGDCYDSKKEAAYAGQLDMLKRAADLKERVTYWTRQVSFKFAYGGSYVSDFLVCYADMHWELVDVKGGKATKTAAYRMKKKILKHEYGIDIKEV